MAKKAFRNAALLGGAALLASKLMGKGKGKDKSSKEDEPISKDEFLKMEAEDMAKERRTSADTTGDASAGMAKMRLDDMDTTGDASAGMARDRLANMRAPMRRSAATPGQVRERSNIPGIGTEMVGAKKGGKVKAKAAPKKYAGGGSVKSVSRRADGCAVRGKTKGRMV